MNLDQIAETWFAARGINVSARNVKCDNDSITLKDCYIETLKAAEILRANGFLSQAHMIEKLSQNIRVCNGACEIEFCEQSDVDEEEYNRKIPVVERFFENLVLAGETELFTLFNDFWEQHYIEERVLNSHTSPGGWMVQIERTTEIDIWGCFYGMDDMDVVDSIDWMIEKDESFNVVVAKVFDPEGEEVGSSSLGGVSLPNDAAKARKEYLHGYQQDLVSMAIKEARETCGLHKQNRTDTKEECHVQ